MISLLCESTEKGLFVHCKKYVTVVYSCFSSLGSPLPGSVPSCHPVSSRILTFTIARAPSIRQCGGHRADFSATGKSSLGRDRAHCIGMVGLRTNSLEDLQKPSPFQETCSPGAHPSSTKDTILAACFQVVCRKGMKIPKVTMVMVR